MLVGDELDHKRFDVSSRESCPALYPLVTNTKGYDQGFKNITTAGKTKTITTAFVVGKNSSNSYTVDLSGWNGVLGCILKGKLASGHIWVFKAGTSYPIFYTAGSGNNYSINGYNGGEITWSVTSNSCTFTNVNASPTASQTLTNEECIIWGY